MSRYAIRLRNDGFMAAASDEAYDFGTGDFTVEAWVHPQSAGTLVARKGSAGGGGNGGWLLVLRADGSIKLATDNGFGFYELDSAPTALLSAGGWHHVAGVRRDGELALFLDGLALQGTVRGTGESPLNVDNALRVTVGATDQQQEPDNHLAGMVGPVRLWGVARSQEQILQSMFRGVEPGAEGLVADWALARPNGADLSPTRNPLSRQGDARFVQPGAPQQGGTGSWALALQGEGSMDARANAAYDFGAGDFTLEAWIAPQGPGTVVSRKGTDGGAGNGGWLLVLNGDGSLKLATDNGFGYFQAVSAPTGVLAGGWHHVAGVRRKGQLALYLNGLPLQATSSGNAKPPLNVDNALPLRVGATDQRQEPFNHFSGEIGRVRVWGVARTQAQLTAGVYGAVPGDARGLVGEWTFDRRNGHDSSPTGNPLVRRGRARFVRPGAPRLAAPIAVAPVRPAPDEEPVPA
ncbi:MAG TPA: LamG domain-containing protein [Longimicrobium sp.]|nr:LamG domain-containing protein [Longimicrobium sp.]